MFGKQAFNKLHIVWITNSKIVVTSESWYVMMMEK